jgi:hypothetical protein
VSPVSPATASPAQHGPVHCATDFAIAIVGFASEGKPPFWKIALAPLLGGAFSVDLPCATNRPAAPLIERACWSPSRTEPPRRHGPIRPASPPPPQDAPPSLSGSERRNRLQIMCIVWMFRTTTSLVYPAWSTKLIFRPQPRQGPPICWGPLPFQRARQNAPP